MNNLSGSAECFLPVAREGDSYRAVSESQAAHWRDMPPDEMAALLNSGRYYRVAGRVEIDAESYETIVYAPTDPEDPAFIAVDENDTPVEGPTCLADNPNDDQQAAYLDSVRQAVCDAEAMYPEQKAYLWTDYVTPKLEQLGGRGWHRADFTEARSHPRTVIVGDPGVGKTCLVRRMVLEHMARPDEPGKRTTLPVYVQLRNLRPDSEPNKLITDTLFASGAEWVLNGWDKFMAEGRILLVLDGLDEVASPLRRTVEEWVAETVKVYPNCRLLLATRPQSYSWSLQGFRHFRILGLDMQQIREFAFRRLYGRAPWRLFTSSLAADPSLAEVAANPLLLSIAVLLFARHDVVPQNRAHLMLAFLDALIDRWDTARGVDRGAGQTLPRLRAENHLMRLAYLCRTHATTEFTASEVRDCFNSEDTLDEVERKLQWLSESTGILKAQDHQYETPPTEATTARSWVFAHHAWLDVLSAWLLVNSSEGVKDPYERCGNDPHWANVWHDAGGLSSDPGFMQALVLARTGDDEAEKASDLLHIALQSPVGDAALVESLWPHVDAALQSALTGMVPVDAPIGHECAPSGQHCLLRLSAKGALVPKEKVGLLGRLIRLIHGCRGTAYRAALTRLMGTSRESAVRMLPALLDLDGELQATPTEDGLDVEVLPESPQAAQ